MSSTMDAMDSFRHVGPRRAATRAQPRDAVERGGPGRVRTTRNGSRRVRRAVELFFQIIGQFDVREILPAVRVPTLVLQNADDAVYTADAGKYIADHVDDAKYIDSPVATSTSSSNPTGAVFFRRDQRVPHRLSRGAVAEDRVLATVLFTDIVGFDATRREDG